MRSHIALDTRVAVSLFIGVIVLLFMVGALASRSSGRADTAGSPTWPALSNEELPNPPDDHGSPPEFAQIEAVGFTRAEAKLPDAVQSSPFSLLLPGYLPGDLRLERFTLMEFGSEGATFDANFTVDATGNWRPAVHTFQTNREYENNEPLSPGGESGTIVSQGVTWKYWLLSFPQTNGSVKELWDAHARLETGTWITVEIRVGKNPSEDDRARALSELRKVLESLAPLTPPGQ